MAVPSPARERVRLTVEGIVQGVGFRPFVYGLALRFGLVGFVGNNSQGVFIEIEGAPAALVAFRAALAAEAPPLSHIQTITAQSIPCVNEGVFRIVESRGEDSASALIPPDIAICPDCLRELFDPADRRYRYPFINCTNCGPRFTIIQQIPYDRPATTMSAFPMCPDCAREYHDPLNRRFHAQPVACSFCGPQIWFQSSQSGGETEYIGGEAALSAAKLALASGQIIAVKGLGGFHLACDATSESALALLRARKGRVDKPFAVMAATLAIAHQLADINPEEAALLESRERPILLLPKKPDSPLNELVAPGNPSVGIMLPYTPLHYLLVDQTPLVMTSGNISGEPIIKDNDEALERLSPLVDGFLLHDRPIHIHCDDSVIRVYEGRELPVRRSRGYTPLPVQLLFAAPPLLAVGGELKNTFCLTREQQAFMSQHIGDMENIETLLAFERAYEHLGSLYRIQPEAVVCDLHPAYLTTRWAERHAAAKQLPLLRVQHHHAHIAALMAEHDVAEAAPVIGVCFDGTGYGTDGAIWGGEFLIADYADFRRAAHLKYVPLPGGDAAIKRPYRLALAHLWVAGIAWDEDLAPVHACSPVERRILARQFETGFQTVPSSSMGRLFDAVASLIGIRHEISYEAQAAIELEGRVDVSDPAAYPFEIGAGNAGDYLIDPAPLIAAVVADVRASVPAGVIAARFHRGVAAMTADVCSRLRDDTGISTVALSGGVFQNIALLALTVELLRQRAFHTLAHHLVPANDGGLALGQAVIGARRLVGQQRAASDSG